MHRLIAAVGAMTMMAATQAAAEDWHPADMADGMLVGVDVDSIRGSGATRTANIMTVWAETQVGPGVEMDYLVSTIRMNCTARTVQTLSSTGYRLNGRDIGSIGADDLEPIRAGSLMEGAEQLICQGVRAPVNVSTAIQFANEVRESLQNL